MRDSSTAPWDGRRRAPPSSDPEPRSDSASVAADTKQARGGPSVRHSNYCAGHKPGQPGRFEPDARLERTATNSRTQRRHQLVDTGFFVLDLSEVGREKLAVSAAGGLRVDGEGNGSVRPGGSRPSVRDVAGGMCPWGGSAPSQAQPAGQKQSLDQGHGASLYRGRDPDKVRHGVRRSSHPAARLFGRSGKQKAVVSAQCLADRRRRSATR